MHRLLPDKSKESRTLICIRNEAFRLATNTGSGIASLADSAESATLEKGEFVCVSTREKLSICASRIQRELLRREWCHAFLFEATEISK